MALRNSFNPFGLIVTLSFSDFEVRTGRGRPQTNAVVTLDMTGVADLVASEGDKRVRNEAFKLVRNQLAIDSKAPIIPNPKDNGTWLIKDTATGRNVHVVVTAIEIEADSIFG
jgi:hypothetical protein